MPLWKSFTTLDGNNTLGGIVRQFLPALLRERGATRHQLKVLWAIAACRTPELGGSAMACSECGSVHYNLHSCRNRHCPRCQGIDKELWVEARKHELLPVNYFHSLPRFFVGVVFTVPHNLLELFRFNRAVMYKLLFGSSETVVEYLGRYTHRVAISNTRIVMVTETHVTFTWCDRKNEYRKETETIGGVEFLKRFLDHIISPYFRRVRHLGFLSTRNKTESLKRIISSMGLAVVDLPRLTRLQVLELRFWERSHLKCRECGGEMHLFETFARLRAPPEEVLACAGCPRFS